MSRDTRTILDIAIRPKQNPKIIEFLRSKGAKTYQELKDEGLV